MKKAIAIVMVILVAAAGLWLGRKPYKHWKQNRFLTQAQAFLAQGDYHNAAFSARKTLEVNPSNTGAFRVMAQINEKLGSPEAVAWLTRVVELEPVAASNRLQLARTALLFGNYPSADRALRGIKGADADTVDFHTLVSMVAAEEGDLAAAEAHSAKAAQLDPNDKRLQLNLAVLQLQSRDPVKVASARAHLDELCADPAILRDALRHLVMSWMRSGDFSRAEIYSRKLQAETPPIFDDNLMHLAVLKGAGSPDAGAYLAGLEKSAAQNPSDLVGLTAWLLGHRMADEALHWLTSLPAKNPPDRQMTDLISDCYAERGDWAKVQASLQDQKWGDLDYLRLAKLAHAFREQKNDLQSEADWHSAVTSVEGQLKPLSVLLTLTEGWKWEPEKEDVAWLIVQRFPNERGVLRMLNQSYTASGNTRGLQKVYAALMRYDSDDTMARNNFAAVSLLLNLDVARAREIAREDCARKPQDAVIASTYAFALYLQGHTKEGLNLLGKFNEGELEKPAVATYYGLLLAATGQREKARPYLEIAARSPLLPEEKALINAALKAPPSAK